jgi:hypothetical protein
MSIDYADVCSVLAEALPDFRPSEVDMKDRLSYIILNDMVRFACDRAYPEYETLMEQFAALFERLISEGDSNVHDLALDALDTVWEHREEREFVARHFGPRTREVWERICAGEHG